MTLTRYEFDDVGMFHILSLLEDCDMERPDAEELGGIEAVFEKELPHPNLAWTKDMQCWFTESGAARFRTELQIFMDLVTKYLEEAGIGELYIRKEQPAGQIVYQDDWQIVIQKRERM